MVDAAAEWWVADGEADLCGDAECDRVGEGEEERDGFGEGEGDAATRTVSVSVGSNTPGVSVAVFTVKVY